MSYRKTHWWLGLATAGLLAVALVGCGGSDGAAGPQGPAGPAGTAGTPGTPGSSGTPGTSSAGSVNLAAITSEAWASANFKAEISKVTVSSPPVVEFSVTDATGAPVVGFEKLASKSATATIASYPNFGFTIAKLMPRTDSKPSSWVNYVVTSVSTTTGAVSAARPSTDNIGKLEAVADKPGSYKYTFYRDVPAVKAQIDGMTFSGNNRKDDLGDLTWQPNLPHRLVIQIAGAAPGTGSNTPTGTQVTPTVNLENALNVVYDFIPATGKVLTSAELTREDVNIDSCNVCHGKLALHGGSARVETRYCVACHTDQRAYGRAMATSTLGMFPALTETKSVNAATGITSYSYSPDTYVADGEVSGNFTTLIHKIHNGTSLVKENYHYAGLAFNNKGFSKLGGGQRMCTTCHDSSIAATADNHKKLPSRQACGACHDGINWQTGGGSTLADKAAVVKPGDMLKTSGHIGRAQADDAQCALCHTPDYIKIDHRMENLTKNNTYILPGLASFTYDIKDVSVNAGNDLIIEFGIKQRVAPSTTETLVTLVPPAASVPASLAGFSGGPSFLLAFAVSQDGVAMPVDYTNTGAKQAQPRGVSIANLLNTNNAANGNIVPSTTTTGYYKATIRGTGAWAFPLGAKLRTVALQGYYTQLNAPTNLQGGVGSVGRHAISVIKTVTGDTARRVVVDNAKCAGCHEWFEGHGGNRVYETQVCAMCHNPGLPTSGRGISDATLLAYNFSIKDNKLLTEWGFNKTLSNAALQFPVTSNNLKDMIHGIHAGRDRVMPFQDARDRTPAAITLLDLRRMDFPGKLGNCETCHVTTASNTQKSYNFVPANTLMSTYESVDAAYAAGMAGGTATTAMAKTALNTLNSGDMVVTPFTASCVSCHDNAAAKAHVSLNGGYVNVSRATALAAGGASAESCAVCHGPTREFDAAKVHK